MVWWRWEMTPAEIFGGFKFSKTSYITIGIPKMPFRAAVPHMPLPDSFFTFQLALGDASVSAEIIGIRNEQRELTRVPGRRSGVHVYDGERLVASLEIDGMRHTGGYEMFVLPRYRSMGLGAKILTEWCYRTCRPLFEVPRQSITLPSTLALLAAHRNVVLRAQLAGRVVPQRVINAIDCGEEAAQILKEAERVEKS